MTPIVILYCFAFVAHSAIAAYAFHSMGLSLTERRGFVLAVSVVLFAGTFGFAAYYFVKLTAL